MILTFALAQPNIPLAVAMGVFILPFLIFSAVAGEIADKLNKSKIIRWIKFAEILIVGLGITIANYLQSILVLYGVLFLLGTHSTFFGPLKYSILPQHLKSEELLFANGWIEASTFVAILLGTTLGGILVTLSVGQESAIPAITLLITIAIIGWTASFFIPTAPSDNPNLKVHTNFLSSTYEILSHIWKDSYLYKIIFGISWFWFVGASLMIIIATEEISKDPNMVIFLLPMATLGIGIGAIGSYKLLRGELSTKYVGWSGLGMSIGLLIIIISASLTKPPMDALLPYLSIPQLCTVGGILIIGICGGFFSVPLYSLLQYRSNPKYRSRNIAANNIMNALFMVVASLLALGIFSINGSAYTLAAIIAIVNLFVSIYMTSMPRKIIISIVMGLIRIILKILYRVKLEGIENLNKIQGPAIIISNHQSLIDAVLLGAFLPNRFVFPIDIETTQVWWIKPFLFLAKTIPIDPSHPFSLKELIKCVEKENRIIIFPEGRITVTGSIMKIYDGPSYVALKTGAEILPIYIQGAQYAWPFSYLKGKVKLRLFPAIKVKLSPPYKIEIPPNQSPKLSRKKITQNIFDLMTKMKVEMTTNQLSIFENVLQAAKQNGMGTQIINDLSSKPLTYRQLIAKSLVLSDILIPNSEKTPAIGLMLPNSVTTVLSFLAIQSKNKIAVLLNYSSGPNNILSACKTSQIDHLWTSKKFVKKAKLEKTIELLKENNIKIKYLENTLQILKKQKRNSIKYLFHLIFPKSPKNNTHSQANDPAIILFTSGSSGEPKAVVLSHHNIIFNCIQVMSLIDLTMQDKIFSVMPIFHAFGLTGGIIGPLLMGIKILTYPTPLHYKAIPEIIYQKGITVLFGTNTFLQGYARYANPYDFRTLRYLFGGAEKIQDHTRLLYAEKFGVRILEGYGTTEAAPAICINTPLNNKPGTVGRFLPEITYKLKPIPDITEGKELWVKGNNIMLGYMLPNKPRILQPLEDNWLNTGDIVKIDDEGYVTILGRTKRFAKIGGEIIALDFVEELATQLWPNYAHACISKPHQQKGEYLILITEKKDANLHDLRQFAKEKDINLLHIPKIIKTIPKLPKLATGKINYIELKNEL